MGHLSCIRLQRGIHQFLISSTLGDVQTFQPLTWEKKQWHLHFMLEKIIAANLLLMLCYIHRDLQGRYTVRRLRVRCWPAVIPWGVIPPTAVRSVQRRRGLQTWSTVTWCKQMGRGTANLARTITRTVTTGIPGSHWWGKWNASTAGVM